MVAARVRMTKNALTMLDNYGHRRLEDLSDTQLKEYAALLQMRRQEVLAYINRNRSEK